MAVPLVVATVGVVVNHLNLGSTGEFYGDIALRVKLNVINAVLVNGVLLLYGENYMLYRWSDRTGGEFGISPIPGFSLY